MSMKKLSERKKKWIERTVANDRSYKVFLYNRFFIFALAVLAQTVGYALLIWLFVYESAYAVALQLAVFVLEIVFVFYIINAYDRPSMKLNWIIAILIAPVFGVPMYLFNGRGRPTRKMREKIVCAKRENDEKAKEFLGATQENSELGRVSRYLEKYASYPVYTDGSVEYYESGEKIFPVMLQELKKAEKFIFVQYFIIAHGKMWNEILKILVEKAMLGVKVRVIYDDFGCMMTLPPKYDKYLESLHENIKCLSFNKVVPVLAVRMNNRDHRKMLVIDGKTAFTGGYNLADEYINEKRRFGYWKDSGIKITGGAVNSFTRMFLYTWNAFRRDKEEPTAYLSPIKGDENAEALIQPYDDCPLDNLSVGEVVYTDMINRAEKYLYIFTPYLILDDMMRACLCQASMRGVDVRIVTPGIPDKKMTYRLTRANYGILLKAGVRIYEYKEGFIHAKSMVSDDTHAVVGTINLDYRSLYHHFENAVYFTDKKGVDAVKRDAEETFALCTERTQENFKRGVVSRLTDSLLRVFETLM